MEIEKAKEYIGKTARYMNVEGEIENVRQLDDKMTLVYFGGAVMNIDVIAIKDDESGKWKAIA